MKVKGSTTTDTIISYDWSEISYVTWGTETRFTSMSLLLIFVEVLFHNFSPSDEQREHRELAHEL